MTRLQLILLVLFFSKHFLADFPLQNGYMLGKGKSGLKFVKPLAAHCLVHAGLSSLIILAFFRWELLWIAGAEFVAHFVIDRIKVSYRLPSGVWADQERGKYLSLYYTAFGLDQWAHGICYIFMVFGLMTG